MKQITCEKRSSPIYPAYKRVNDYCVHLEPELVQSLKEITAIGDINGFMYLIIDMVGINPYLRGMIERSFAKESNQPALTLHLRNAINNL